MRRCWPPARARDRLSYRRLRTLAALDPGGGRGRRASPATASRARPDAGDATIAVVDRGGIARDLPSRTERNPRLRGTKHRVATEREVLVARGRRDGRTW